jgi:hypothetical protein
MLEEKLLLLFGPPIIIVLTISAWRRARALAARIAEVRAEMAASTQDPYQALAEIYEERNRKK